MNKTKGNMSGQHRREHSGRIIWIRPEVSKNFEKLKKKNIKDMTDEELQMWMWDCIINETMGGGNPHKYKSKWVKLRKKAEIEFENRKL